MDILRIDMKTRAHRLEALGKAQRFQGGRAMTSRLVHDEVPPTAHPLSRFNKLVIAPGLLSGTAAANSGRISVGAKSPLTGGIKESNSGGLVSQKLVRLGIAAVVLEEKPEDDHLYLVLIRKGSVEILSADDLRGMGTYGVIERLWKKFGKRVGVMCIGPAGEQRLTAASIQFADPKGRAGRAAGRGGLGAVMGSKGIKAIVVDDKGTDKVPLVDPDGFKIANRRWTEMLKSHPVSGQGLPSFGTAILVNLINEAGALPTKNFRSGRFEHAADISGERMAEMIVKRGGVVKEGCHPGCVIHCSQAYHDKKGRYLTSGFEYETIWAFGAHTLIKDLDDIAVMDRLCDDIGVDTIEMGVAIGLTMESGLIPWGDGKAAIGLLKKVGSENPMGRVIGNGAAFTGQAFGLDRVPVVKRQALPAYDPRAVKGVGVTYATSPMGADHTAGYAVCQNVLKVGGTVDPLKKDGNAKISKFLQMATAAIDATGLCLFTAFAVLDNPDGVMTIVAMINALTGGHWTPQNFLELGVSTLETERRFNHQAGLGSADDRLPEMFTDPLPPHNTTWDFSAAELQEVVQQEA
jgi:aldehyde:ferredoxin oxidoreductase